MRTILFGLLAIAIIAMSHEATAQAVESKIMDTAVEWSGNNGTLKVFLTDADGVTGLVVAYGSTDSTSNYFEGTYAIPGSFQSAGGTVADNVLSLPMGSFGSPVTGYLRITVLLEGDIKNEIAVVK